MLTPLQISTQRFTPNGKGGYRAAEVDAFMQKLYKSYTKLYNDNNILNEKIQSVSPTLEEYNKSKAAIANALISAQTVAETMLEKAQNESAIVLEAANKNAEAAYEAKKSEADKYYTERTQQADIRLRELEYAYAKLQKEADDFRDEYIAKVNAQIATLIADANEKAADIVSAAYNDAKLAKDKADEAVANANNQLQSLKDETAKIKGELSALILVADSAVKSIGDYSTVEVTAADAEQITADTLNADEFAEFKLDIEEVSVEAVEEAVLEEIYDDDDEIVPVFDEAETEAEPVEEFSTTAADEIVDLFSHSSDSGKDKNEIPDVSAYLSKIFDSVNEDDDSFGFENLISES